MISVLIVSKGHAYNHDAFLAMFEGDDQIRTTLVEQPAAQVCLRPENVDEYDTVLFYDMSGIPGIGLLHDGSNDTGIPSDDYRHSIEQLVESGKGMVLLNHGTVGWPLWPLWRQIHGSSFMLKEGDLDGVVTPGSGYRGGHGPHPNPTFKLTPEDPEHPVVEGLENGFTVTDEIYIRSPSFENNVLPLMRSDYEYVASNFTPPPLAPPEEQASWDHPPGSNLVVWANAVGNAPVVASDIGDSPEAFGNPGFRRLLKNALKWVGSQEARDWAANR
ncbi:MAG: ThuA domain-containing protein [Gammaproteobacteria bacterium]|nr:ThuA domain-containing protein [Gammaproteobacteria bacterium]